MSFLGDIRIGTGNDLLETTDAQVWAREFVRSLHGTTVGGVVDEGTMIAWFANAMAAQEMALRGCDEDKACDDYEAEEPLQDIHIHITVPR